LTVQGQCSPITGSTKPPSHSWQNSLPGKTAAGAPDFFDQPQFTVAGVTDASTPGGHGSDIVVRTKETLARETASLSKEPTDHSQPSSASPAAVSENSLREAVEHDPDSFDANHQLGKLLVDEGKAHEAIPFLERASRRNPTDSDDAYELALALAHDGEYQRARTTARTLLTSSGQASQSRSELHHLLGDVEEKLGNPLEAVREYQRAAELDASEPNLFDWGAELLMHRALEPASDVFTRGNSLFPGSVRMLLGLGVALYDRGAYDQAARSLCEASDLNPADSKPYLFMGKLQAVETTQPQGMGQRLERFAQLQPENALANYYYAVSVWQQRKGPEDAENSTRVQSLLEKAVHLDPKLGPAYLQLGILYAERKDWRQAILSYQQAAVVSPQLEEAHYRLAQAYRQTGEKVKAEQELQLHAQIKKETSEKAERERLEILEFVYTLRDQPSVTPQQAKP
jgi:tetratricopeptide (TPR) repeat protein